MEHFTMISEYNLQKKKQTRSKFLDATNFLQGNNFCIEPQILPSFHLQRNEGGDVQKVIRVPARVC